MAVPTALLTSWRGSSPGVSLTATAPRLPARPWTAPPRPTWPCWRTDTAEPAATAAAVAAAVLPLSDSVPLPQQQQQRLAFPRDGQGVAEAQRRHGAASSSCARLTRSAAAPRPAPLHRALGPWAPPRQGARTIGSVVTHAARQARGGRKTCAGISGCQAPRPAPPQGVPRHVQLGCVAPLQFSPIVWTPDFS